MFKYNIKVIATISSKAKVTKIYYMTMIFAKKFARVRTASLLFSEKPLFLRTAMQEAPLPVFLFIVHIKLFLQAEIQCDRGRFFDFRLNFRYAKI